MCDVTFEIDRQVLSGRGEPRFSVKDLSRSSKCSLSWSWYIGNICVNSKCAVIFLLYIHIHRYIINSFVHFKLLRSDLSLGVNTFLEWTFRNFRLAIANRVPRDNSTYHDNYLIYQLHVNQRINYTYMRVRCTSRIPVSRASSLPHSAEPRSTLYQAAGLPYCSYERTNARLQTTIVCYRAHIIRRHHIPQGNVSRGISAERNNTRSNLRWTRKSR